MPAVEGDYEDLLTDVLDAVADTIEAAKKALGLKYVRVGNRLRGWNPPAAFVLLGGPGAPVDSPTGRRGVRKHMVHVDIVVVGQRSAQESQDRAVLGVLGKLPGTVHAAMPLARTRHMEVLNAGEVGAFLDRSTGAYETEGRVQLSFEVEASLSRPDD